MRFTPQRNDDSNTFLVPFMLMSSMSPLSCRGGRTKAAGTEAELCRDYPFEYQFGFDTFRFTPGLPGAQRNSPGRLRKTRSRVTICQW